MSLLCRLVSLVGLALLPSLAALIWGAIDAGRARQTAAQEDAMRVVRLVAADHQRLADGARQLLTVLGNLRAVHALDETECQSFFQRIMADFPRYVVLATATLEGEVVCSAQSSAQGNRVGDREYFRNAVVERRFVVGGFVTGRASGQSSFHFAQPFFDDSGVIAGVVHAAIGLNWLAEQVGRMPLPDHAVLSIIDREGTVLAARPGRAQQVGQPVQGPARHFLARRSEGVEEGIGPDGVRRIYAYVPADADGAHMVVVGFDQVSLFATASAVQRKGAMVLFGTTLLALLLTMVAARGLIRRPVERMLGAAERWRQGDTAARLEEAVGGSEFARLAAAFNAMAAAAEAREGALRDSEAEFRAIFETAAVGVAQLDLRHRRIERVNRRLCELLDRGEAELVGSSLSSHVHPEELPPYLEALDRLVSAGQGTSVHRALRSDGAVLWLRIFASVSERSGGVPVRAVAILQDVTEQRMGEEADARLAAIVTSAAEAIISLSGEEGRIVTWNKGAETLFGYPARTAVGLPATRLVPPEDEEGALYGRALSGETIRDHEAVRMARDGTRIPVAITMTRMLAPDGRVIGVSVILRDLRELRAADQQQRLLMREIDHRAKNVMAVVRSLVQLSPKNDPAAFGRAIEGRIAAMARAHSLLARDRWEGASFRELVEEELGGRFGGGDLPAQAELDGPAVTLLPDTVQPLSMVLHELVTNSVKYGALSRQEGRVALRWRRDAGAEGGLSLLWTETGGPTVEAPPRRSGFGSRLMEISARHQLRGAVSMEWRPEGLVAHLRIGPSCLAAPGMEGAPLRPAAPPVLIPPMLVPPEGDLGGIRVLLAEDEVLVALEAVEALSAAGCRVLGPAATLEEGFALAERPGPLDAAILDVNLAGQDVGPLAERLVARGVPVLFTTGYGEAPSGHPDAPVLTKPVPMEDLVAAVRQLVGAAAVSV